MSSFLSRVNRKFVSKVRHHFLPISSNFFFLFFKMAWNRKYANALRVQKVGTSHLYELQISSRCSRFFWIFLKFSESIWSSQPPIGSDPIQSDPDELQMSSRCSRFPMLQNALECFQMLQNASKCTRMLSTAFKCSQMLSNAIKCFQMHSNAFKCIQMLSNAFKCFQMLPKASKRFQMLPNASRYFRMLPLFLPNKGSGV